MVRPEVIHKRLQKLDEYLKILTTLQRYSREAFLDDPEHYGSAERFLQLAIEALTDMANHVIADDNLGTVSWYSDIPQILYAKHIISEEQKDIWLKMIGFRNTLVHEYIDIDRSIVFDVLQHNITDLEGLKQVFADYL